MSDAGRYDVVVLGATGYTGQYVLEEIARIAETKRDGLTYALAGRNKEKLSEAVKVARSNTGLKLSEPVIIVADVNNEESLVDMARMARVVINCVGPYRYYGDRVVAACIKGGANQVDISGEPQYLERAQLEYHKEAEQRGVYVVGSCGFDSIPADLGTTFLQQVFPGDLNSVEAVMGFEDSSEGSAPINVTTLECAVLGLTHSGELKAVRKKLFTDPPPKSSYKPQVRGKLWYSKEAERWCLPNYASDRSVVIRSQYVNYQLRQTRPTQFVAYFGMQSIWTALAACGMGLVLYFMTLFAFTRKLIIKYPGVFTFGAFSRAGPKRSSLEKLKFCVTLTGLGWADKLSDPALQHTTPPNVYKTVKVVGPDPGYFGTAILVTRAALTILDEADRMPGSGGVFPPGAAFLDTTLKQRLNDGGISFTEVH